MLSISAVTWVGSCLALIADAQTAKQRAARVFLDIDDLAELEDATTDWMSEALAGGRLADH